MKTFFIVFHSLLSRPRLGARRRNLAKLLDERSIELQPVPLGNDVRPAITRLVLEARAAPVVALDDKHPLPDAAPWLADLTREVLTLEPRYRPQLVYVTRNTTAAGAEQALRHAVVRKYIGRDEKNRWVATTAEAVLDLAEQLKQIAISTAPPPSSTSEVVGESPCFRAAMEELVQVMQSPYGMVSGERGVGKLFLIRAMWREMTGKPRAIVLPCGSFFKDYYVAGARRRIAGGREAVDQLTPYLRESHNGLLVLHNVEQLPTALQEELAARLPSAVAGPKLSLRLSGVDRDGLQEYDVKVIATSTHSPELLHQTGRLIPDLAAKLRKRHVRIPSLLERGPGDLRLLCEDVARRIAERLELNGAPMIDENALALLGGDYWPENLSDLVRVLEQAVRRSRGGVIRPSHLPLDPPAPTEPTTLKEIVARAKRTAIENALQQTGRDVAAAAKLLGCHRGALHRLMGELGIGRKKTGRRKQ
ncbi:MAG: sigma 54-interacting transcriptional regulator [Pirellulales bacterium]|nr:sigma 54-interacting transcriptional regulator [Pirellulales bacterium]